MIFDKNTMLVKDFEGADLMEVYTEVQELVLKGTSSENIQGYMDDWERDCGSGNRLLTLATVFPQRVLLSIIENFVANF